MWASLDDVIQEFKLRSKSDDKIYKLRFDYHYTDNYLGLDTNNLFAEGNIYRAIVTLNEHVMAQNTLYVTGYRNHAKSKFRKGCQQLTFSFRF
jgi:hypothetical protein